MMMMMMIRRSNKLSLILLLLVNLTALFVRGLTTTNKNSRNVCIFKEYSSISGPHFDCLFDQLVEQSGYHNNNNNNNNNKRVAYITVGDDSTSPKKEKILREELQLDDFEVFRLDTIDPLLLEDRMNRFDPTIFWSSIGESDSALQFRYYMRTSGFDTIVEEFCGSIDEKSRLFIGEGIGAVTCVGSDMTLARNDDEAAAPEPQYRGLELLGSNISVSFENDTTATNILKLNNENKIYVWSQQDGEATSFFMNSKEMGAIEKLSYPTPLPPLQEDYNGGRKCTGEPAIDPSRMIQTGGGDSEWFD